jgi:hypothetical protein
MDMNYYLHREQVERVRAKQAGPGAAGDAHRALADLYREKIEGYRAGNEAPYRPQMRVV